MPSACFTLAFQAAPLPESQWADRWRELRKSSVWRERPTAEGLGSSGWTGKWKQILRSEPEESAKPSYIHAGRGVTAISQPVAKYERRLRGRHEFLTHFWLQHLVRLDCYYRTFNSLVLNIARYFRRLSEGTEVIWKRGWSQRPCSH